MARRHPLPPVDGEHPSSRSEGGGTRAATCCHQACVARAPRRHTSSHRVAALQGKEVIIWEAASKAVKSSGMVFHQVRPSFLQHVRVAGGAAPRRLRDDGECRGSRWRARSCAAGRRCCRFRAPLARVARCLIELRFSVQDHLPGLVAGLAAGCYGRLPPPTPPSNASLHRLLPAP